MRNSARTFPSRWDRTSSRSRADAGSIHVLACPVHVAQRLEVAAAHIPGVVAQAFCGRKISQVSEFQTSNCFSSKLLQSNYLHARRWETLRRKEACSLLAVSLLHAALTEGGLTLCGCSMPGPTKLCTFNPSRRCKCLFLLSPQYPGMQTA